jgi:hypothetical protein
MSTMEYVNSEYLSNLKELIKSLRERNRELVQEVKAAKTALLNSECHIEYDMSQERHLLQLIFTRNEVRYDRWFVEHMLLRVEGHLRSYEKKMKAKDLPRAEVKDVESPPEES